MTTRSEKEYMGKVARLGCCICDLLGFDTEDVPPELHHVRAGQGMSQRASNFLVVPLCPSHHRGPHSVHGDRQSLRMLKVDEMDLLAWVIQRMAR